MHLHMSLVKSQYLKWENFFLLIFCNIAFEVHWFLVYKYPKCSLQNYHSSTNISRINFGIFKLVIILLFFSKMAFKVSISETLNNFYKQKTHLFGSNKVFIKKVV